MIKKRGFTLLESMVAVAILAISVAAPIYAASRALVAVQNAKDQLTASFLAQEGVEFIRMNRDTLFLIEYDSDTATASAEGWESFITRVHNKCASSDSGCWIDPGGYGIGMKCSGYANRTCPPLYLTANGEYRTADDSGIEFDTDDPSIFTRVILMETVDENTEKVTSTVSWDNHGKRYEAKVVDYLTAWQ